MCQYYGRAQSTKECSKANFQSISIKKTLSEVVYNYQTKGVVVKPPYFERRTKVSRLTRHYGNFSSPRILVTLYPTPFWVFKVNTSKVLSPAQFSIL